MAQGGVHVAVARDGLHGEDGRASQVVNGTAIIVIRQSE